MSILAMTVKQAIDLDVSIENNEKVVLIHLIILAFATHKFNMLIQE